MDLINFNQVNDVPSRARILRLHPAVRQEVVDIMLAIQARGVGIRITHTLRTIHEQNTLYAKGRTAPGAKVTNARGGQSYHNYGLALDFVLVHADGTVSWSLHEDLDEDGMRDWLEAVEEFTARGWEWGGAWELRDNPHVQKRFGLDWKEMLRRVNAGLLIDGTSYIQLPSA